MSLNFEKLEVWQKSRKLAKDVYTAIADFPKYETYALGDQIRRAVISVPSNIAEGNGRSSLKVRVHFLGIVYGSLMEVYCQITLAVDFGYITETVAEPIKRDIEDISRMISGLSTYFRQRS